MISLDHETEDGFTPKAQLPERQPTAARSWLKRLGLAGFLFFFIKGALWLIVPILLARGFFGSSVD